MQTKICTKCKQELSINKFTKNEQGRFGVYSICKICKYAEAKAQHEANPKIRKAIAKKYYKANLEKYKKRGETYRELNPQKIKNDSKAWREANKERCKAISKAYRKANKEKIKRRDKIYNDSHKKEISIRRKIYEKTYKERRNALYRKRYKTDPKFNLNRRISKSIRESLKINKKNKSWEKLVGYTIDELKKHIERKFTEGMTWELLLKGDIHIDHIIPIVVHNFTKPEHKDFLKCWALKNLQPLWAKDNLKKHAKLTKHFQPSLLLKG